MARADAGIGSVLAGVSEHGDVVELLAQQRHVDVRSIAPQPQQRRTAAREQVSRLSPAFIAHADAWPRAMPFGGVLVRNAIEQGHGVIPIAARRSGSRQPMPAAYRCLP